MSRCVDDPLSTFAFRSAAVAPVYLDAAVDGADEEFAELVTAVDRLLTHADSRRRLAFRANADTAEDAARARSLGAQGNGLYRTEHMFPGR